MGTEQQRSTPPPAGFAALALFLSVGWFVQSFDTSPPLTLFEAGSAVDGFPPIALLAARATITLLHAGALLHFTFGGCHAIVTDFYKRDLGSHLQEETVHVSGIERCATYFTVWTYAAQGIYFALATWASAAATGVVATAPPLRALHALFELSTGCSLLVTIMITFVIWPDLVREGKDTGVVKNPQALLMHNVTVAEVLTELVFGRVPLYPKHIPFALYWGAAYVVWTWFHAPFLARNARSFGTSRGNGANFAYFFLDYTLPQKTYGLFLVGLAVVLSVFYMVATGLQMAIGAFAARGVPLVPLAFMTYGCGFMITKWRD